MVLDKGMVVKTFSVYSNIVGRCIEVLNWKNRNGKTALPVGGTFDTNLPLHIVNTTDKGVLVSNGNQIVLVTYSELGSDNFKVSSIIKSLEERSGVKFR